MASQCAHMAAWLMLGTVRGGAGPSRPMLTCLSKPKTGSSFCACATAAHHSMLTAQDIWHSTGSSHAGHSTPQRKAQQLMFLSVKAPSWHRCCCSLRQRCYIGKDSMELYTLPGRMSQCSLHCRNTTFCQTACHQARCMPVVSLSTARMISSQYESKEAAQSATRQRSDLDLTAAWQQIGQFL